MRDTLTVSIPRELRRIIDKFCDGEGLSRSDLVRQSLQDFLFTRQFRGIRERLMSKAQQKGLFSDEDIFKRIS